MKSNRHGKLKGMKFFEGKPIWIIPKHFNGASKRGVWEYELGDIDDVELDNGMVYTKADL